MNAPTPWVGEPTEIRDRGVAMKKGVEDYLRALRRRFWLALLIAVPIAGAGIAFTLLQKPIYFTASRILIEPPQALVQGLGGGNGGDANAASANFFNTRVEMITSRQILERVLTALKLSEWSELHDVEDPVAELLGWISVVPVKSSNLVDVGIEGSDPKLVAKIVNTTIDEFIRYEQEGLQQHDQLSRRRIEQEIRGVEGMLNAADQQLRQFHEGNNKFLVSGENVEATRLNILEEAKALAELRVDNAKREVERFQSMRKEGVRYLSERSQHKIAGIQQQVEEWDQELALQKRRIKPDRYEYDPAIRGLRERRDKAEKKMDEIGEEDAKDEVDRLEQEVRFAELDYKRLSDLANNQRNAVLEQQDDAKLLATLRSQQQRRQQLGDFLEKSRLENEIRQGLTAPRIQVIDPAQEPRLPVRPKLALQIALSIVAGLLLGVLAVMGLEFLDKSIRVPDQASASLDWPLLAVLPRIGRRALQTPQGTLQLASEMPGSQLCEAFRNLRMGVLGAESDDQLRSLLIASAKSGEGKSLVAANLAATCARAGESVCLVDMDLRKPSLGKFFPVPADAYGLTNVLEGQMSWEQAVLETSIPNLTILPTGGADDVPLDILGTIEMHDLLGDLVEKFDRVILDGPAVLGLADSRAVGRFADGVLVVLRSGAQDSRSLARLRQLCDHEGLNPVGIVFNGLSEQHHDLANYGSATPPKANPRRPATIADAADPNSVAAAS